MSNAVSVQERLGLRVPPVAVAFLENPPAGLPAWSGAFQPAGCSFWQKAQEGAGFYTVPSDHYGCAVGAYTHHIDLPPERSEQLNETVGFMVESDYIRMEEVPGIPRLEQAPGYVAYGPAEKETFQPDVVLLTASPAQAMLIYEAALRCGAGSALTNLMGRRSCAVLPFTRGNQAAMSLGCAGNRLYAGLRDDEFYIALPGERWSDFRAALSEAADANERMRGFYRQHQAEVEAAGS
jgi:uncharacterized protein (DUF169 family)